MLIKVLLVPSVRSYWQQYGDLSIVVNRLLNEVDYQNKPTTYPEDFSSKPIKSIVDVLSNDFLDLREILGPTNPQISLSRILTYFCTIDYATTAGWNKIAVQNLDDVHLRKKYSLIIGELNKLEKMIIQNDKPYVETARNILYELYYNTFGEHYK